MAKKCRHCQENMIKSPPGTNPPKWECPACGCGFVGEEDAVETQSEDDPMWLSCADAPA